MTRNASKGPKVSVCVPTYNGFEFLKNCLDSILEQTHEDFELIAIDDCSSDETLNLLSSYARQDVRVRVLRNANNLGLVGNWNRCLAESRGEWIKFVFQDDFLAPTCLERMLSASEGRECSLTVCRREFVFESVPEQVIDEYAKYTGCISPDGVFRGKPHVSAHDFCLTVLEQGPRNFLGEPTAVLIRRDALAHHGLFNPDLIQLCDLEYWLRLGMAHGITYVPETLAFFRIHGSSTSSANASDRRFRKDVVDPLLLRAEFAFSPYFDVLRRVAVSVGKDLRADFENKLISAQRWGRDSRNPEWAAAVASFPQLRMPLGQRLRKFLRNALDDMRGTS